MATYEYNIASTSYFKICERANVTDITDLADEVLAFRITVTGTNILGIADCVVRMQPTVNGAPRVTVNYQTRSTSASTTGIRYLRILNPKAASTSYKYEFAISAYNTTTRHVKVEVFKAPSTWTFSDTATAYSYNSTYQTATDITLYDRVGIIGTGTLYMTANYASYAGYKSSWDGIFNSQGNFLAAGAAIAANQFVFFGKDNKVYPTTSTAVEIDPAWPIVYCTTAVSSGAAVTWSYLRSWGYFTPAASIGKDTLVADDTVYMRCAYVDGKLYSSNTMTQSLTAGNTYIKLGKMYSTTAVSVNTYNSEFFTLDADGSIKALNGYLFTATKASAVSKSGTTAAGSYGVLLDSNQITDIINTTTSPRVNASLTFNPSTGNLSSTLFTGSGAGLTNIPVDELSDVVPLDKGGTGLNGDDGSSWHGSAALHPKFKLIYLPEFSGFNIVWDGPLDGISSVSDFLASDYFKFAQRETHPIVLINGTYLGSAMLFTGAFDVNPDPTKLYFVFPDAIYFSNMYVNGVSCSLAYSAEDGITADLTTEQPSIPKWAQIVSDIQEELPYKEDVSNKVTSIDSSSDDDQYPSAKAVYDAVTDVENKIPSKVDYSNTPFVGTCSTAAGTMAKTVTVDSSFQLVDGIRVRVYMNNANTNAAPTLNVNSTGAKAIGIQGPYGSVSNVVLSAWYAGAFNRNGWFDFVYAASYNSGNGRWIIEDSPASIRLANFAGGTTNTRLTTINSTNGTLANGGVRYTVVSGSATGNPFAGTAAVLWLSHDNSATYTRQIAMSASTPPHMAFRAQDSGGGTNWQPWEYVLTAANHGDTHMATLAYTAANVAFDTSNHSLAIPINGTQYKILQVSIFNNDFAAGSLGYPALFIFNAAGSSGYLVGTSTYCLATSAASGITLAFDQSWPMSLSSDVDVQVLYRRIS